MSANQLLDEMMPGIGHNMPPLLDLEPHRERQAELLEVAKTARIIDEASAAKVLDLDRQLRAFLADIEKEREEKKKPFLTLCRQIDADYGSLTVPLKLASVGESGRDGIRGMLSQWDRQERERVDAERQRREAEARQAEAEAEAARRLADEQRGRGSNNLAAELEAMQAADNARRLAEAAAAVVHHPLRSNLGQLGLRREITFTIIDLRKCLGWMLRQHGLQSQIEQAARTILGKYLRGLGVEAIDRGVEIPGVAAGTERVATVRS